MLPGKSPTPYCLLFKVFILFSLPFSFLLSFFLLSFLLLFSFLFLSSSPFFSSSSVLLSIPLHLGYSPLLPAPSFCIRPSVHHAVSSHLISSVMTFHPSPFLFSFHLLNSHLSVLISPPVSRSSTSPSITSLPPGFLVPSSLSITHPPSPSTSPRHPPSIRSHDTP